MNANRRIGPIGLEFADLVVAERKRRGMSQLQLGRLLGVGQQAMYQLEVGAVAITVDKAYALVALLFDDVFPSLNAPAIPSCEGCDNKPPVGFTCNRCQRIGEDDQ